MVVTMDGLKIINRLIDFGVGSSRGQRGKLHKNSRKRILFEYGEGLHVYLLIVT